MTEQEEQKKKSSPIRRYLGLGIFFYLLATFVWNSYFTHIPDELTKKVQIESVEEGEFSPTIWDYFSPYDRKITTNITEMNAIFAESDMDNFELIQEGETVWVNVECVEASSWRDVFLFGLNFNYEITSIPDQNSELTDDSLTWTSDVWVLLGMLLLIPLGFIYSKFKKTKSTDSNESE
jgi:hypothetical protein